MELQQRADVAAKVKDADYIISANGSVEKPSCMNKHRK